MTNRYIPKRYRNDSYPPLPSSVPMLKTMDAVLSYIAKQQAFICKAHGLRGYNHAPRGITKSYIVKQARDVIKETTNSYSLPRYDTFSVTLFVYDKATSQWYRNAEPLLDTENHACYPCTPPDKTVIPLPTDELLYLANHGVMGLMEAKLNGVFFRFLEGREWNNKYGTWIEK